ncbi:hypothetical protein M1555_02085 [Patescibacteria group bacterium]|nr:hypothetical protein [Patescibacteria group bacterium]
MFSDTWDASVPWPAARTAETVTHSELVVVSEYLQRLRDSGRIDESPYTYPLLARDLNTVVAWFGTDDGKGSALWVVNEYMPMPDVASYDLICVHVPHDGRAVGLHFYHKEMGIIKGDTLRGEPDTTGEVEAWKFSLTIRPGEEEPLTILSPSGLVARDYSPYRLPSDMIEVVDLHITLAAASIVPIMQTGDVIAGSPFNDLDIAF